MAENNPQGGAQNKLGELFVEFSTKGLPSLLKNLNSVSASFLLSTKAAKEFIDTVSKPFKNDAVSIGKMASMLGARKTDIDKLGYYFKSKKLNPTLIQDIAKRQQMYANWQGGTGGMDSNFLIGMNKLGLDWTKYNKSFESQLQLTQDLFNRQNKKNAIDRVNIYSLLGANPEWAYANERDDFNLKDAMSMSDKAIEDNIRAAEAMAEAEIALNQAGGMFLSKFSQDIVKVSNDLTNVAKNINNPEVEKRLDQAVETGKNYAQDGQASLFLGLGAGLGEKVANKVKGTTTGQAAPLSLIDYPKQLTQGFDGAPTGGAAPVPDFINMPAVTTPSEMNNLSQNITITNQNNITGDNAQEIATEIARINAQDIEYTQYQLQNLTGI